MKMLCNTEVKLKKGIAYGKTCVKEWVHEVHMTFQRLNVPRHVIFSTTQKSIVAHKHRVENKVSWTKL